MGNTASVSKSDFAEYKNEMSGYRIDLTIKRGDVVTLRKPWGSGQVRMRVPSDIYAGRDPVAKDGAGPVVDVVVFRYGDGFPSRQRWTGFPVIKLEKV